MSDMEADKKDKAAVPAQLRGETIAYAVQSGISNLAANFYEPYINYRIQRHYSGEDKAGYGNYTQNLAGELAGDLTGSTALILAETLCPEQLHNCTRTMRSWVDPIYDRVARRVLANEKDTPDYEQKVEKWKTFQERNLVRSTIMATAGIAGNIATQKLIVGNPSPTKLIFLGKLASTALTTAIGLTVRFTFPDQMKSMDKWMGKHIGSVLEDKGVAKDAPASTHVAKLTAQDSDLMLAHSR